MQLMGSPREMLLLVWYMMLDLSGLRLVPRKNQLRFDWAPWQQAAWQQIKQLQPCKELLRCKYCALQMHQNVYKITFPGKAYSTTHLNLQELSSEF